MQKQILRTRYVWRGQQVQYPALGFPVSQACLERSLSQKRESAQHCELQLEEAGSW